MASTFTTLRKRGYGTIYAVKIEGLPYVFTEGPVPLRVDSAAAPSAPAGYTASAAFAVVDDTTIDQEIDRQSSVARGKSLDLLLSWEVLEAEGILDDIFRRPAYFTTLASDLTASANVIEVDNVAAFPSSGNLYIGRELVKYTGKDDTTTPHEFTGCSRGYLGYAYKFDKDEPGSHGMITPTPHAWKGRFVTVYEHLVSPEGRILDSTWTEGSYNRELWKGYISEPPKPDRLGMKLSAMPLVRLAAQELGSTLTATTIGVRGGDHGVLDMPVYAEEGAGMIFNFMVWNPSGSPSEMTGVTKTAPLIVSGAVAGDYPTLAPGVMTIREYVQAAADQIASDFSSDDGINYVGVADYATGGEEGKHPRVSLEIGTTFFTTGESLFLELSIDPTPGCYWFVSTPVYDLWPGNNDNSSSQDKLNSIGIPTYIKSPRYLAVRDIEGNSAIDFAIPSSGMAVVEAGDTSEVIRWDEKHTTDYLGNSVEPYALLRVSERMVGAEYSTVEQLPADFNETGKLEVVAGVVSNLPTAAQTLLESSGTGLRGDYDTLGLGFGYGVPEGFIDLDGTGAAPLTMETIPVLAMGRTSWADLFSGWYRLGGLCLVQRRDAVGTIRLMAVDTSPAKVIATTGASFLGFELAKSDVVVGGTEVPRLIVAPNQIIVDTTAGPYESADYTFNAVGRIQSEGAHSQSFAVPGGRVEIISAAVLSVMSRGQGQSIVKFKIAPWVAFELGDPVSVTVGHPVLFDWSDGTRQPSNVPGRVVGASFMLKTGEQEVTILLDGMLEAGFWLAPTTRIQSVAGSDVTVTDGSWFRSGETVRFYTEGKEATEDTSIVATTVSGNVLTLASSPPAWFSTATKVTYPVYTSGSTEQTAAFMYDRSDRSWR